MLCKIKDYSFIADVMLGKLARWLRILGFDVIYDRKFDDESILKIALSQNRIVLTKDTGLVFNAEKNSLKYIFIKENNWFNQLKGLIHILNIVKNDVCIFSRCPNCNSPIKQVAKKEVEDLVPDFVYNTFLVFSKCRNCGKVYWDGSHKKRVEKILDKLFEK